MITFFLVLFLNNYLVKAQCDPACASCYGTLITECYSCVNTPTPYYLQGNECKTSCTGLFYGNGTTSNICVACTSNCTACDNSTGQCSACDATFYLTGTFTCDPCDGNCTNCSGSATNCTTCTTTFLDSLDNTCKNPCPDTYWGNSGTFTCDPCDGNCTNCSGSATNCTSCTTNYLDSLDNTCKDPCPDTYWGNSGTFTCDPCDGNCTNCSGSATNCTSCTTNYLDSLDNTCKDPCPDTYWGNSGTFTCDPCDGNCTNCSGSATNCTSCTTNYLDSLDNTCKDPCPDTYWGNSGTFTCDPCDGNCTNCSGSATNCTSCTTNYLDSLDNTCKDPCPDTYWGNSGTFTCDPCDGNCTNCSGSATNCTSCTTTFLDSLDNTCKDPCPDTYWANSGTFTCDPCDSNCTNCTISATQCTSCTTTFLDSTTNTCVADCPTGWWEQTSDNTCQQCDTSCLSCSTSAITCQTCADGFFLNSATEFCDTSCPAGQTAIGPPTNQCQDCDTTCTTCDGLTATDCLTCTGSLYLDLTTNECVIEANCGTAKYGDNSDPNDQQCLDCDTNCTTCEVTAVACTSCTTNFLDSLDSTCKDPCPDSYWENTTTFTCDACDPNCETCQNSAIECTSCNPTYLDFDTNTCVADCPAGFWEQTTDNTCQACDTSCQTCSTSAITCQTCTDGFFHIAATEFCDSSCPPGTGPVGPPTNQCQPCHATCTTCNGVLNNNCLTCTGTLYKNLLLNTCIEEINCGTYKYGDNNDLTNQQCLDCDPNCYTCDITADNCLSCIDSYLDTLTNTCVDPCPDNYLGAIAPDWECQACDPVCETCYGFTNEECLTCVTGKFKELGTDKCIDCPDGTYGDTITKYCELCHPFCTICTGNLDTQCSECADNYYLNPDLANITKCQENCIGTDPCTTLPTTIICEKVTPKNTCIACHINCLTCHNIQFTGCSTCFAAVGDPNSRFLYLTQCVLEAQCPSNYFPNFTNAECNECDNTCLTCQNFRYECTSCNPNYHLLDNVCRDNGCPDGMWADDSTWECKDCHTTCLTCNPTGGINDCINCPNLSYLLNGACITDCPVGMWEDTTDNTCKMCDTGCYECDGSSSNCQSCIDTYFLNGGTTCLQHCPIFPVMEYAVGPPINECVIYTCNQATCKSCRSVNTAICLECDPGNYLDGSICTTDCGFGRWEDTVNQLCQNCDQSCVDCTTTATQCIGCTDGYFYYAAQSRCITNCYDRWYPVGPPTNECRPCDSNCNLCDAGSNTDCLSCNNDYYLIGRECFPLSNCPDETYGDTNRDECMPCIHPCKFCSAAGNTGTFCLTCQPGYYLYQNQCLSSCLIGWIGNNLTWECEECHPSCMACDGVGYNQCTQCSYGSSVGPFLLNKECVYPCPNGTYQDVQQSTCELCDFRCETCYNAGYDNCYTCTTGYYYLLNSCIEECGLAYYANNNDICISCDPSCKDCNGSSRHDCTMCELNRIFENGTTCRLCSEYYGMEDDPSIGENQQMVCREICGDGITVSDEYECDDGNNIDGDGCSAACKVEAGFWKCINGDANTPHQCYDYRSIGYFIDYTPKKYYNYDENEKLYFQLRFNKTFELPEGRFIEDYLSFGFPDMEQRYEYEIIQSVRILQTHTNLPVFSITMKLTDTIKQRPLSAFISNIQDFSDGFGQTLSYSQVQGEIIEQYIYYKETERKTSETYQFILFPLTALIVLICTLAFFHYKFYINQFFNAFLTLDLMQQIYFYRFINVRWSLCMIKFFDNQRYFTNFFILNFLKTEIEDFSLYQTPYEAFNIQEEVLLFFNTCGSLFQLFVLILVIFMIIQFLGQKNEQNLKCQPFFGELYKGYMRFNLPVDLLLAVGGVFFTYGIISITAFQKAADFIVGVACVILTGIFYTVVAVKLVKNRHNFYKIDDAETSLETETIDAKCKRSGGTFIYRTTFIHTKYEDQQWKGFLIFGLILRKIQLPFCIMMFQNYQNVMITSQLIWHVVPCAVLLKFKILKENRNNYRFLCQEFLTLVGLSLVYGLVGDEKEDEEYRLDYNWGIISVFTMIIVINAIYLLSTLVLIPLFYYYNNSNSTNIQIHNAAAQPNTILNYPELMKNQGKVSRTHQASSQYFFGKNNKKIEQEQEFKGQHLSQREVDNIYKKTGVRAKINNDFQLNIPQYEESDYQGTQHQFNQQIPMTSDLEYIDSPHLSNEEKNHLNADKKQKHRKQQITYNLHNDRDTNKDLYASRVKANNFVQGTMQNLIGSSQKQIPENQNGMILKSQKAKRHQSQFVKQNKFNIDEEDEL